MHITELTSMAFVKYQNDMLIPDRVHRILLNKDMHDYIEYLADVLTVGGLEERVKAVEILMKDGKMQELEARLERIGKEEQHE